jgi:hypothetical protein
MKYYLICLLCFLTTISFSQLLTESDIKKMAEKTNTDFRGVDIGNGVILRSSLATGRTIIYQYDIPDESNLTDNLKNEVIRNYKTNGFAKLCYNNQINVELYYFQRNSLQKRISINWNELSELNFKLGEYISIKDHPKAKGVNLKLQQPIGWRVAEGERPNIVTKFVYGNNMYLVLVKDNAMFLSRKEATDLLSDEVTVQEFIQEQVSFLANAKVLSNRVITVDNYPTLEFTFSGVVERVGVKAKMIGKMWLVLYEDKFVFLQSTSSDIKSFNALEPLYNLVTNSVIFPEQYD